MTKIIHTEKAPAAPGQMPGDTVPPEICQLPAPRLPV